MHCHNDKDTKDILDELEKGVGFVACNAHRSSACCARRCVGRSDAGGALGRLPAAERGTSGLLNP